MITELDMLHGFDYRDEDVLGWLMSEKLNGCRAYWDGSTMWTRSGNVIVIPDAMRSALPAVALDGEMFAGRENFQVARVFVQYGRWDDRIEFCVFDAPAVPGDYAARYAFIEGLLPYEGVVNYIQHDVCEGIEDALLFMRNIQEDYGGEGVMLRDPAGQYKPGYHREVLKLKEEPV